MVRDLNLDRATSDDPAPSPRELHRLLGRAGFQPGGAAQSATPVPAPDKRLEPSRATNDVVKGWTEAVRSAGRANGGQKPSQSSQSIGSGEPGEYVRAPNRPDPWAGLPFTKEAFQRAIDMGSDSVQMKNDPSRWISLTAAKRRVIAATGQTTFCSSISREQAEAIATGQIRDLRGEHLGSRPNQPQTTGELLNRGYTKLTGLSAKDGGITPYIERTHNVLGGMFDGLFAAPVEMANDPIASIKKNVVGTVTALDLRPLFDDKLSGPDKFEHSLEWILAVLGAAEGFGSVGSALKRKRSGAATAANGSGLGTQESRTTLNEGSRGQGADRSASISEAKPAGRPKASMSREADGDRQPTSGYSYVDFDDLMNFLSSRNRHSYNQNRLHLPDYIPWPPKDKHVALKRVKGRGLERGWVFPVKGPRFFRDSLPEHENKIYWTREEKARMKDGIVVHNHPEDDFFSEDDLGFFIQNRLREVWVVTANGDRFGLCMTDRPIRNFDDPNVRLKTIDQLKAIIHDASMEINQLGKSSPTAREESQVFEKLLRRRFGDDIVLRYRFQHA